MKKEFGQPLSIPPFKGRIQASYNYPLFIKAISDCHNLLSAEETEILLDSRNKVGVVSLPKQDGGDVDIVIKEFRSRGVNWLKSCFLPVKAFKAWNGGMALVKRGIETPPPVAYMEKRKGLALEQSFFLAERISGVEEIRSLLLDFPLLKIRELLSSLGKHLFLCHKKGILHRDLSDGNILVREEKLGEFRFYLIDTNRIRVKSRITLLKRIKNLIRLGVPPEHQRFFLEEYLGKTVLTEFLWFWYKTNKRVYSNYVELKKKLRLRKLARKLKIQ
ncbi:MAG: hypothetical protein HQ555_12800 [Candidatus Aminicenantes bacterium]|nr:hypothetical protein [Candidatus Aminicenantes bacterium]